MFFDNEDLGSFPTSNYDGELECFSLFENGEPNHFSLLEDEDSWIETCNFCLHFKLLHVFVSNSSKTSNNIIYRFLLLINCVHSTHAIKG